MLLDRRMLEEEVVVVIRGVLKRSVVEAIAVVMMGSLLVLLRVGQFDGRLRLVGLVVIEFLLNLFFTEDSLGGQFPFDFLSYSC